MIRTNQCLLSDARLMITLLKIISFERDFTLEYTNSKSRTASENFHTNVSDISSFLIVQQLLTPSVF